MFRLEVLPACERCGCQAVGVPKCTYNCSNALTTPVKPRYNAVTLLRVAFSKPNLSSRSS